MGKYPFLSGPDKKIKPRAKKRRPLQTLKKYHKWPALIISLSLLLFAVSGIVLNHRSLFSSIDVNRQWLPSEYTYDNWNLASVKSALKISEDSVLIYGNIGIWLTDEAFSRFTALSEGIAKGIDNRKIFRMLHSNNGDVYAGSLSGLYKLDQEDGLWLTVDLPVTDKRIVGMVQKGDSIYIMTRSHLLASKDNGNPDFEFISIPSAYDDDGTVTLFRTLWLIHSGKIYGIAGKLIVDFMAIILIFLVLSGLLYFFTPGMLKKISTARARSKLKRSNRFFIKWHNTLGYYTVFFLVVIALTGIFLRPPLLIPISGTRVPVIKKSWLDNPNPWFDKFRDLIWDEENNIFLYATSEGIYYSGPEPSGRLMPLPAQPPVSVMGVNVFEINAPGEYLVGSFSGIYRWIPGAALVKDHVTGKHIEEQAGLAPPFGNVPVAGRLEYLDREILFSYLDGAFSATGNLDFAPMPEVIIKNSPISLWNLALEIHTGRIFFPLVGNFYILYIPLVGISTLVVLVSGFLIWWRSRKRKKTKSGLPE